ncbi:MAG: type I 3-dehydroquinate dehydratase [Verrucomicrobiota bacterium]
MKKILWKQPCLRVGCISTVEGLKFLREKADKFDMVEVRLDMLKKNGVKFKRVMRAMETRRNPALLTLRTRWEGGSYSWKSRERILLFEQLMPFADIIDVELSNVPLLKSVLDRAVEFRCHVILSAHSIQRKLTSRKIHRLIKEFQTHEAKIYKIAGLGRTPRDLAILAKTLLEYPQLPLAVMAIGPMANFSRLVLSALGSRLVYGYLDAPTAKNQPSIRKISDQLKSLGMKWLS